MTQEVHNIKDRALALIADKYSASILVRDSRYFLLVDKDQKSPILETSSDVFGNLYLEGWLDGNTSKVDTCRTHEFREIRAKCAGYKGLKSWEEQQLL